MSSEARRPFRVGVTRDLRAPDGTFGLRGASIAPLDETPGIEWAFLERGTPLLTAADIRGLDAILTMGGAVDAATLDGSDRLTLVARHGVGLDGYDLAACAAHGVAVTITAEAVRLPMAGAALALILASLYRLKAKDRAAREAGWPRRFSTTGLGISGRTLGLVGLGRIGSTLASFATPLGLRVIATTRSGDVNAAAAVGVELVDLDTLMSDSDVVCLVCPLTPSTRGLIDARRLARMRPGAHLVNVGRGELVDEAALVDALRDRHLGGAALDVFAREPMLPDDPLLELEDVLLAPHAAGFSDELFAGCVASACQAIVSVARGVTPAELANREVLDSPLFRARLAFYAAQEQTADDLTGSGRVA